jgi:hypothetical protein
MDSRPNVFRGLLAQRPLPTMSFQSVPGFDNKNEDQDTSSEATDRVRNAAAVEA